MKICAMNDPFKDLPQEIEFVGKHGFQGFELVFEYPTTPEVVLAKKDKVLDALSSYNLVKIAHTQAFVDICNVYETVRKASLEETFKALETAHMLDIRFLTLHAGYVWPVLSKDEALKRSYASIEKLLRKAEELDLILGVENLPIRGFTRVMDFEKLFSRIESNRLQFVFDVAHTSFRESDSSRDFIRKLFNKMAHVHLSDNMGERDDHLPLGLGKVDYETTVRELMDRGYNRTITLEIFAKDKEYLIYSKSKLKQLLEKK
ncbi:sugar phosphate isomerase/epimerase [Candidatus Bathyarchaeota archaeon]|nr:sugar phosphate isomerase/epimerase [Candidatus Bathyarchaeota archaeon]